MQVKAIVAPEKGINKFVPSYLIQDNEWSDGNNVWFGPGYAQKSIGWLPFLPTKAAWISNHAYTVGSYIQASNGHVFKVTTGGTSGGTQPSWPTSGTKTDGTVTWTECGVSVLTGNLQIIDIYYPLSGGQYLMFLTTSKVYYFNPSDQTYMDITGGTLTGLAGQCAFSVNATGWWIFTNGFDPVSYWSGTGNIQALPGLTNCEGGATLVRAKCIAYFDDFLILGNTTENGTSWPQRIRWSQYANITTWVNDTYGNGQAGYADLTEYPDGIQNLVPLESYLVAYKERSIQVLYYAGSDVIWQARPAIMSIGALSPAAIVNMGNYHIFAGPSNFYTFDLVNPTIIGNQVKDDFMRLLNPTYQKSVQAYYFSDTAELGFTFVSINSPDGFPDRALIYNTLTGAWGWRDLPMLQFGKYWQQSSLTIAQLNFPINTWDTPINSSNLLQNAPVHLCGDGYGQIYSMAGDSKNGSDIDGYLVTKLFDLDDPGHMKRLLEVQVMVGYLPTSYSISVYIGTTGNVDVPITWNGPYAMSLGSFSMNNPPWIECDLTARYFSLKFETKLQAQPFKIMGYILKYQTRGEI